MFDHVYVFYTTNDTLQMQKHVSTTGNQSLNTNPILFVHRYHFTP